MTLSPLPCIVTSYARPKYLEPCLRSMRENAGAEIKLYVVDGGSDAETKDIIEYYADDWVYLKGNPGADVLKNVGIAAFIRDSRFCISSDDYLCPEGWAGSLIRQYEQINQDRLEFPMVACATTQIQKTHAGQFKVLAGVKMRPSYRPMVACTMMDTATTFRVGLFPVYGKSGQGDRAIGPRMHKLGYRCTYLWEPALVHLGVQREVDYPEYSRDYQDDALVWLERADADDWQPTGLSLPA